MKTYHDEDVRSEAILIALERGYDNMSAVLRRKLASEAIRALKSAGM